jgi:hypothetical protein
MKKGLFAILAVLTVFALVMTGCDTGTTPPPPPPETWKVSFDTNGGTPATITAIDVVKGTTIGTKMPTDPTKGTEVFVGWYLSTDTGFTSGPFGTKYTSAAPAITGNITLKARWSATAITFYTVSFDTDGGTPATIASIEIEDGNTIGSLMPTAPTKANKVFGGWYLTTDTAFATKYTATSPAITEATALKAKWDDPIPPGPVTEDILISNGWYTIFKFDLPTGKTVGDYTDLEVDYKIASTSTTVRSRVFGNYTQKDLDLARLMTYTKTGEEGWTANIAVLGSWPGGTSNRWIMNNKYGSGKAASEHFAGMDAMDNEWFTAVYPKVFQDDPAGNLFAGWDNTPGDGSASLPGRKLTATSTGPLYLGVGLTTDGGITAAMPYSQKNIVLKGAAGTDDVVGKPVFFKKDGELYRAYAGQIDGILEGTPNTASGEPGWKIVTGDEYVTIDAPPDTNLTPITVSYNVNYPAGTSDTPPAAPASKETIPGSGLAGSNYSVTVTAPTTPSAGAGKVWVLDGWYTVAATTGGFKPDDKYLYYENATLYARWKAVDGVTITYNNGGGTGSASVEIEKGKGLSAAQLKKPAGLTAPTNKIFGGFYAVDTAGGSFDYEDYSELVTTSNTFSANTTIYAYWYTPYTGYATFTGTKDGITSKDGNARVDEDGYFIFTTGANNEYLGNGGGDTLIMFKWPDSVDPATSTATLKISYALKDIIVPDITGTSFTSIDAAYAAKRYDSYSGTVSGNYASWTRTATESSPATLSKAMNTNWAEAWTATEKSGIGFQINAGDDGATKRAGYIFGIKILSITYE